MHARLAAALLLSGVVACATPGQVKRVETQVAMLEREHARADSARAAQLTAILTEQQRAYDSLVAFQQTLATRMARMDRDNQGLYQDLNRQLVRTNELLASSQGKISELRNQIETSRSAPGLAGDSLSPGGATVPLSPSTILDEANSQNRAGSLAAARLMYRRILDSFPTAAEAPEAMYGLADTFDGENQADSAQVYWSQVVKRWPKSVKAPTSLYKLGMNALARGNRAAAKDYFKQIVDGYKDSLEYDVALRQYNSILP
jgi:TolA-binding protein